MFWTAMATSAALLALAGGAAAFDGSEHLWNDIGATVGTQPLGVCYFADLAPPEPGADPLALLGALGSSAGAGLDYDGNCAAQAESPSLFAAAGVSFIGLGVATGFSSPAVAVPLPELPLPALPELPQPPL